MNKAINVNLAGMVFFINEDAYQFLQKYLEQVKAALTGTKSEIDEVMSDVENRIAELLKQRLTGVKEVADMEDIKYATEIIGSPSDFGSGNANKSTDEGGQRQSIWKKRLYRDADNNVFGGVCSGLAHWLDIDTVLMRILFVILFFVGGSAILIYIILWIIIPKAKTELQKREMRSGVKDFAGVNERSKEPSSKSGDFFSFAGDFLKNALKALAKVVLVILGVIFAIIGIVIILALVLGATVGFSAPFAFDNLSMFFYEFSFGPMLAAKFFISLLAIIPAAILIYAGVLLLMRKRFDRRIGITALLLWFVSLIVVIGLIISNVKNNGQQFTHDNVALEQTVDGNTINISCNENIEPDRKVNIRWFGSHRYDTYFRNDGLVYGTVSLVIEKSSDSNVQILYKKDATADSEEKATKRMRAIEYQYNMQDSTIVFDKYFNLSKGEPFHAQNLEVVLYVPEGKTIVLDNSVDAILKDADVNGSYYISEMAGQTWVMGKNGLELKGE
jgi:phage shock protein PspC (stress-responsive transcriptional regulator)